MAMECHSRVGVGGGRCLRMDLKGKMCSKQTSHEGGGASEASFPLMQEIFPWLWKESVEIRKWLWGGSKSITNLGFRKGNLGGNISSNYVCGGQENKQIKAPTCKFSMEAWSSFKVQPK